MNQNWITPTTDSLLKAILSLKNINEARGFFRDLLTEPELKEFSRRWQVAQMLQDRIPYSDIEKKTGMSTTTIARISKWLKNGQGYRLLLDRFPKVESYHHHSQTKQVEGGS